MFTLARGYGRGWGERGAPASLRIRVRRITELKIVLDISAKIVQ
jgi:hypothetical protein